MRYSIQWLALSVILAAACNRTEGSDTGGSGQAQVQTAGDPRTQIPDGTIPTPEDYEEEVQEKLRSANLEAELDHLEAELEE